MQNKVILVVMDGVGNSINKEGNAFYNAKTPNLDYLINNYPNTLINASGEYVGLVAGDMGNSEVGHNALGSGQIYPQGARLVEESINNESIFNTNTWHELINYCKNNTLHFIGLLSDGNVHSNINHLFSMLEHAKKENVSKVRIHILLDGRDTGIKTALKYVDMLEEKILKLNDDSFEAKIASGGGRMKITMDRYEANWNMVELGYKTHVLGEGKTFASAKEAINYYYDIGQTDQYIDPFVISDDKGNPIGKILDYDSVIFFNFRGDRAIEISRCFDDENFSKFEIKNKPKVYFAGMLQYDADLKIPKKYLLQPPHILYTLTEELVKYNLKEYAISETQKYGHVTYFWNGNRQQKISDELEDYELIPSDNIPFDLAPKMKSYEITNKLLEVINSNKYDFIRVNYPNGDMVGHTGNYLKTIESIEALDDNIGRLIETVNKNKNYIMIILADHGNAEEMYQKDGTPKTSHTTNLVPFILYGNSLENYELKDGTFGLANIASTVTTLLGVEPNENWLESIIKPRN